MSKYRRSSFYGFVKTFPLSWTQVHSQEDESHFKIKEFTESLKKNPKRIIEEQGKQFFLLGLSLYHPVTPDPDPDPLEKNHCSTFYSLFSWEPHSDEEKRLFEMCCFVAPMEF